MLVYGEWQTNLVQSVGMHSKVTSFLLILTLHYIYYSTMTASINRIRNGIMEKYQPDFFYNISSVVTRITFTGDTFFLLLS